MESMKIGEIVRLQSPAIELDTPMKTVINLLLANNTTGLPVIDKEHKVVGFLSEKDCIEKMLIAAYHCDRNIPTVNDAMTTKVVCFTPEDSLVEVAKLMTTSTPKIYPVVENGKYIGIITRTDVLKALFTKTEHCFGY